MNRLLLAFLAAVSLWPVQLPPPPRPPDFILPEPARPPAPFVCDGSETPCDPDKPWMRGHQEKSCARPDQLAALRAAKPGQAVLACACHHLCDAMNKYAEQTDRRMWDGTCEARCNPKNCTCPHPCDT